MALDFPTKAEMFRNNFFGSPSPVSLSTLAVLQGADKEVKMDCIEYTFDDDSVLRTRGRGKSYRVEVDLP